MHFAWLMLKEGKMSKSEGTAYTVRDLVARGYDPMAFRYLLLQGHYRQPLEFSFESLDAAAAGYKNIVRKIADLMNVDNMGDLDSAVYNEWHDKILAPASDNMKTAESLVVVQDLLKDTTVNPATKLALFEFVDRLLGLQFIDRATKLVELERESAPAEIIALADERATAKANKDWTTADALRAEIDAAGWTVLDGKDGYKIVKKA
jgi:cysteinyl-tRNA synthetase